MLGLALVLAAHASVLPSALPGGNVHLQSVRWEQDHVVLLVGHLGYQTMIRFADGERIENVAIGDATAWQVVPNKRADLLFVKPTGRGPATNMVVVTNQRTYAFALSVASPRASVASAVWTLRFVLPVPPSPPAVVKPAAVTSSGKNGDYTMEGAAALFPDQAFDDGQLTYLAWPEDVALPAVFSVNPDGSEAVVNFVMRDGYLVVQQTAGRFVLRRGDAAATLTSTPGVARRKPTTKGPKP